MREEGALLFLNRDMPVPAIRRTPMTKSRRTASASPAQRITAAIIEKLEQGIKPWRGVPVSRPLRSCGTPYRGMNTFWLWMVADGCGYVSPYWMTYRQCQKLGGQVFYKSYTKEVDNAEGEADIENGACSRPTPCSTLTSATASPTSTIPSHS